MTMPRCSSPLQGRCAHESPQPQPEGRGYRNVLPPVEYLRELFVWLPGSAHHNAPIGGYAQPSATVNPMKRPVGGYGNGW
jgi:hypothetical protein